MRTIAVLMDELVQKTNKRRENDVVMVKYNCIARIDNNSFVGSRAEEAIRECSEVDRVLVKEIMFIRQEIRDLFEKQAEALQLCLNSMENCPDSTDGGDAATIQMRDAYNAGCKVLGRNPTVTFG